MVIKMDGIGANNEWGFPALAMVRTGRDYFFELPEEIQEQVNAHANEFRSEEEMRRYIRDLTRRA